MLTKIPLKICYLAKEVSELFILSFKNIQNRCVHSNRVQTGINALISILGIVLQEERMREEYRRTRDFTVCEVF